MPKWWFDYRAANTLPENATEEDIARRDFNLKLLADRKPYFMRYIYPKLMHQYNKYVRDTEVRCQREFCMGVSEMMEIPANERTERQAAFLKYYEERMPVSAHGCTMNRICRKIEREFDAKAKMRSITEDLDISMLKCGVEYSRKRYYEIAKIYRCHMEYIAEHNSDMRRYRDGDRESRRDAYQAMLEAFREDCAVVCSNEAELCDIVIDLCYAKEGTKQFAWDVCGDLIVSNLLSGHDGEFYFPILDPDGDIDYCGQTFSMMKKEASTWLRSF